MTPVASLPSADGLWTGLRTASGADWAIVVERGLVRWAGERAVLPDGFGGLPAHDGGGALVTPGLVDCHTHLVYGGQRANEFAMRLAGATYEEVAKAGGGIVSSVRATRSCLRSCSSARP